MTGVACLIFFAAPISHLLKFIFIKLVGVTYHKNPTKNELSGHNFLTKDLSFV
jgi:hypothetical protein